MLKFLKSSAWSGLSVVVRAVASLAINKLFAVLYGPNGITLLAHFQNLLAILCTVPNGGINIGLIKYLAPGSEKSNLYRKYFWAGLVLNLLALLAGAVVLFSSRTYYFGAFIAPAQPGTEWLWYVVFFLGTVFLVLNLFLLNVLLARGHLPSYVLITILSSMLGVVAVWLVMDVMSVGATLLAFLWGQCVWFAASLLLVWKYGLLPSHFTAKIPRRYYRDLGKFILMALSTLVFMKMVDFFVRDYVIARFDLYQTGLWQAVAKISDNYSLFYTSIMGMVYYTHLAKLVPEPEKMRLFVRKTFYSLVPVIGGGLLFFYLFSDFFISLLYAREFLAARYLLDYQLIGDFLKLSSYIISSIISVQASVKLYLVTQAASGILYILLLAVLIDLLGLEGVTMAHALRYGGYLLFMLIWFRKIIF